MRRKKTLAEPDCFTGKGAHAAPQAEADPEVARPLEVSAGPSPVVASDAEATTGAADGTIAPTWADLARMSQDDDAPDSTSAYARVRAEAESLYGPGHMATLRWIDARCQLARMHGLDAWWLATFADFYASGKLVLACRVGLRGAKSVSVCRALVNDALFMRRDLDPGTVGVIPVMSADRTEATDRFHTIKKILRACGFAPEKQKDDDGIGDIIPGGVASTYKSSTLPSGGGVIVVLDSQGHEIQFRIYPARITGAVGYTGVAGFCDEVDLWPVDLGVSVDDVAQRSDKGKANPGDVVLDRLLERFTTTMASAHLYIVSASYRGHDSAHARKMAEGDTPIQMVARLGELGARRDFVQRAWLASQNGSTDARLLSDADPASVNVPAWVNNPSAPIETCYALSRSRLGPMFGRYGGRPDDAEGGGPLAGLEIKIDERLPNGFDTVIGLAPPEDGSLWAAVMVRASDRGFVVTAADVGPGVSLAKVAASVIACAKPHEKQIAAECAAYFAATRTPLPPLAPQDVHPGTLATLYAGPLTHAPGLEALASAVKSWSPDRRDPRVEALTAAVARLAACYPWIGAQTSTEPLTGPRGARAKGGVFIGGPDAVRVDPRPLWAR